MDFGQDVDLFVLFIQQVFELLDLRLQRPDPFFQRLGVPSRKRSPAEFIARLALEPHRCALRAAWRDAVASDLLGPASIAGLSNSTLRTRAHLDHFHREYSRHLGRLNV